MHTTLVFEWPPGIWNYTRTVCTRGQNRDPIPCTSDNMYSRTLLLSHFVKPRSDATSSFWHWHFFKHVKSHIHAFPLILLYYASHSRHLVQSISYASWYFCKFWDPRIPLTIHQASLSHKTVIALSTVKPRMPSFDPGSFFPTWYCSTHIPLLALLSNW